ncbi:actinia tenebrosa protease inhibitors-like [Bicyclus anynana]|uniref:Actinia tenebrosa protease inhibitors-like n=1 Tax=Bicyclus anynana TaxID=110368 RepID=A0A6J1MY35_BICAN|nr:actinia tenebrosa protease inhibitors-like [Bicyclus anynana]
MKTLFYLAVIACVYAQHEWDERGERGEWGERGESGEWGEIGEWSERRELPKWSDAFHSEEESEETEGIPGICLQDDSTRHCFHAEPKYYYSPKRKRCLTLRYVGCVNYGNNFKSIEECERTCSNRPTKGTNICLLKPNPGRCHAFSRRFYYSHAQNKCIEFTYGGCGGNGNRFSNKEECERTCERRNCEKYQTAPVPRFLFYLTVIASVCAAFDWGERIASVQSESQFVSEKNEVIPGICLLKREPGSCIGHFNRYYYSKKHKQCFRFIYGGCGGNANKFETVDELRTHPCLLKPKPGFCYGDFPRFYFSHEQSKCIEFSYGGCGGNANRFRSPQMCELTCLGRLNHGSYG